MQLAEVIRKIFKEKTLPIQFEPLPKDDPKQRKPDITKAKLHLAPWTPTIHLEQGLEKMIEWLKETLTQ